MAVFSMEERVLPRKNLIGIFPSDTFYVEMEKE